MALKKTSCDLILQLVESKEPKGQLRIILRVFDALFRKTYLGQAGACSVDDRMSPMGVFLTELGFQRRPATGRRQDDEGF